MKIKYLFHFILLKYYGYSIMELSITNLLKDLFSENIVLTWYTNFDFLSIFLTKLLVWILRGHRWPPSEKKKAKTNIQESRCSWDPTRKRNLFPSGGNFYENTAISRRRLVLDTEKGLSRSSFMEEQVESIPIFPVHATYPNMINIKIQWFWLITSKSVK